MDLSVDRLRFLRPIINRKQVSLVKILIEGKGSGRYQLKIGSTGWTTTEAQSKK